MKVSEILKEQLEELCDINSALLKKAKEIKLGDSEIATLEIVNYSINKLGNFFLKVERLKNDKEK